MADRLEFTLPVGSLRPMQASLAAVTKRLDRFDRKLATVSTIFSNSSLHSPESAKRCVQRTSWSSLSIIPNDVVVGVRDNGIWIDSYNVFHGLLEAFLYVLCVDEAVSN